MAIKSKAQLAADIAALGATYDEAAIEALLNDMVDSYEDIFPQLTTAQRNALTPSTGQIIYNTDNDRYEYWNGSMWLGMGQDLSTPMTVKIDLSAADLATLFSVPVQAVAAPGAGYAAVPYSCVYRFTYGSVVYDFVDAIRIRSSSKPVGTDIGGLVDDAVLNDASDSSGVIAITTAPLVDTLVENNALMLQMPTSDPTTGDGTLTLWLTYSIIAW